jgi:glycerol-1-phosphate dehydrogenase [NAD(P)+]
MTQSIHSPAVTSAPSFRLLEDTLRLEGVLTNPRWAPFVPWQAFVSSEKELGDAFLSFLDARAGGGRSAIVFVDGVPKACGVSLVDVVFRFVLESAGVEVQWVNVSDVLDVVPEKIHASVDALPKLRNVLRASSACAVVVIGSGTLTDLVKHALHEEGDLRAFLVAPTALTVTAFTSAFAVLEEAGAKRTRVSRPVSGCLWHASVLAQAPASMSRAGYGDLLARFVAYGDWYLSHELGMAENYDERAYRLMEPFAPLLKGAASAFGAEEQSHLAVEMVGAALSMAGIAMSVSGETTPLSGYEHVISHALDFLRLSSGRPLAFHGEQVALATLTSAVSFDLLCATESLDPKRFRVLDEARAAKMIAAFVDQAPVFGRAEVEMSDAERAARRALLAEPLARATELFMRDYAQKAAKWAALQGGAMAGVVERWPAIRARLRELTLPASEMESLLIAARLPLIPEDLSQHTTAMEYRWAVRFSPFVRGRMSLGDFLFWIGEDPAHFAAI